MQPDPAAERFRLARGNLALGVWDWDIATGSVTWDEGQFRVLGLDPSSFTPSLESFKALVHPDDLDRMMGAVQDALDGVRDYDAQFRIRLPDGSIRHLTGHGSVIRDPAGAPVRMVGVNIDISSSARTQEALRESEERFRRTFDESGIGMALVGLDGRFLRVNRALCDMLGQTEAGLLATGFQAITHPDDLAPDLENVNALLAGTIRGYQMEKRCLHKLGGDVWVILTVSLARGPAGEPLYFISQIQDITHRKRAEEEAARAHAEADAASRAKSEFLASMSHEIRTPMNGVLGMAGLLLQTSLAPEQREFARLIHLSAEGLLHVVNDILDLSKIEAGKLEITPAPFSPREELAATLKSLALRAEQKGLELLCRADPALPEVLEADPLRLRQVVVNLVGNAIKFTDEGEVEVSARMAGRDGGPGETHLEISVRDTGPGIPPGRQEAIFRAFEQESGPARRGGTGLGLTISTRLARLMGGSIRVQSEPGKGSTFRVLVAARPAPASMPASWPAKLSRVRGEPVLIAAANASTRAALRQALERAGMEAFEAATGAEAEARVALRQFAAVVLDSALPGADALRERLAGLAVLLGGVGGAAQLTKPASERELVQAVHAALAGPGQAPAPEPAPLPPSRPLRILLAEDDPVNQFLALRILERCGHRAAFVTNGRDAVAAVQRQAFDVVLMDWQMPVMGGADATRRIREWEGPGGRRVPIIALTAHALVEDRQRCLDAGCDAFLTKPFLAEDLAKAIHDAVPARREGPRREPSLAQAGSPAILQALIRLFLETAPESIAALADAVRREDAPSAVAAAHKLRGAAGVFGDAESAIALHELELAALAGEVGRMPRLHERAAECLDRLSRDLLAARDAAGT